MHLCRRNGAVIPLVQSIGCYIEFISCIWILGIKGYFIKEWQKGLPLKCSGIMIVDDLANLDVKQLKLHS